MAYTYLDLFILFLEHYGFQETNLQSNKESVFKESMRLLNPKVDEREINKLTGFAFRSSGPDLLAKREAFKQLLNGTIISSNNDTRIFLFDTILENNDLKYYIEHNSTLGRAFIMLYFNGINLASIHINENSHLEIVHKQYLYQLNCNTSFFEQTLFNVLYAKEELYFGRVVKNLDLFNHVVTQPFHRLITTQMIKDIIRQEKGKPKLQLILNLQEDQSLAIAFNHVNLILNHVWSLLSQTYALKTNLQYTRL
ncbi:MAG: hypothetical protein Q4F26_01425 [Atopococcus tabaci]|uniref:Uncharacterized protein n=1 Tax=Atopococcus tabaci TaxID=269774 RepID=A0AA43UBQ3_9LACT|nr:hypothetical protein [Atopococcus tabaci]